MVPVPHGSVPRFWRVVCTSARAWLDSNRRKSLMRGSLRWELKEKVYAFTDQPPASRDGKFCEEIRKSARSAPDNIAEGFYRFNPPDFANFVRIARGSLGEVRNQLMHAHARRYLKDEQFRELSRLCRRAIGASRGLRLYLLSLPKDFDPRQSKASPSKVADRPCEREPVEPEPREPEP